MRDEMDGRLWDAHHAAFSDSIDAAIAGAAQRLGRIDAGAVPAQLLAALAAVGLTLLTFTGSAA